MCAVVMCLVISGAAASAHAADNGAWSIFPTTISGQPNRPVFDLALSPGIDLTDSVTVTNRTDAQLTFNVYPADDVTTADGSFSLKSRFDGKEQLGKWVTIDVNQVTLPAQSSQDIPFAIHVPLGASPGDYAGGIVVENVATTSTVNPQGVNVNVVQAVGTRIYARVEGVLAPGLRITQLAIDTKTSVGSLFGATLGGSVVFTIVNTGNIRLTPTATLKVASWWGSDQLNGIKVPELLPGSSITLREPFTGVRPFGPIKATVTVKADGIDIHASTQRLEFPWALLGCLLLVFVALVVWRKRRRKRDTVGIVGADVGLRPNEVP